MGIKVSETFGRVALPVQKICTACAHKTDTQYLFQIFPSGVCDACGECAELLFKYSKI